MRAALAAGRALLARRAGAIAPLSPEQVPLRLDRERGVLRSALARRLAAAGGGDPAELARRLAAGGPEGPFSQFVASGSMVELVLSPVWMRSVADRYRDLPLPAPPPRSGLRRCDREDDGFLLWYTQNRCRSLSRQGPGPLPAGVVCLLAEEARPLTLARRYWALSPALRRDGPLAHAVGAYCAAFTKNSPCPGESAV